MKHLDGYLKKLPDVISKIKYEQLILGQAEHPRRVKSSREKPAGWTARDTMFFSLSFQAENKGSLFIDGNKYILNPGDIYILDRDSTCFLTNYKSNINCEYIRIFYNDTCELKILNGKCAAQGDGEIISVTTIKMPKDSQKYFEGIFSIKDDETQFKKIKQLLVKWSVLVKQNIINKKFKMVVYTKTTLLARHMKANRIKKAVEYLRAHYKEKLSLKELAAMVNLHPVYFSALFNEAFDLNVIEFIRHLRIYEACRLLRVTDTGINEIAGRVGYEDPRLLQENFRKVFAISPTNYRKRLIKSKTKFVPTL